MGCWGAKEQSVSSLRSDYLDDRKVVNVIIAEILVKLKMTFNKIQALEVAHHPSAVLYLSRFSSHGVQSEYFQNCISYHTNDFIFITVVPLKIANISVAVLELMMRMIGIRMTNGHRMIRDL